MLDIIKHERDYEVGDQIVTAAPGFALLSVAFTPGMKIQSLNTLAREQRVVRPVVAWRIDRKTGAASPLTVDAEIDPNTAGEMAILSPTGMLFARGGLTWAGVDLWHQYVYDQLNKWKNSKTAA